MQVVLKFKDGMAVTQAFGEDFRTMGEGHFFELIRTGKMNNSSIRVIAPNGVEIERRFDDLYSFEIVL